MFAIQQRLSRISNDQNRRRDASHDTSRDASRCHTRASTRPGTPQSENIALINCTQQKHDMQDLNQRFATHLERVHYLQTENTALRNELAKYKARWDQQAGELKSKYNVELQAAVARISQEDARNRRGCSNCTGDGVYSIGLQQKLIEMKAERDKYRETSETHLRQLTAVSAEIKILRDRVASIDADQERHKREVDRLNDCIRKVQIELENEKRAHCETKKQSSTLQEQMKFSRTIQKGGDVTLVAKTNTKVEHAIGWKNEMAVAIRDMQATYDRKLGQMRAELEAYYNKELERIRISGSINIEAQHAKAELVRASARVSEYQAKVVDAEATIAALRKELQLLRAEFAEQQRAVEMANSASKKEMMAMRSQMIEVQQKSKAAMGCKGNLSLEISAYKSLLDREEARLRRPTSSLSCQLKPEQYGRHSFPKL